MKYLLNHTEMKACDDATIQRKKVPSEVLMERAALAVYDVIRERFPQLFSYAQQEKENKVLVLAGSGNNGGDGFAVARLLTIAGVRTDVIFLGKHDHMTAQCRLESEIFLNYGGQILPDEADLHGYSMIIDALFGIGLSREILGRYADLIHAVNRLDVPVLSIDIPSGVSADDGQILGTAVRADLTVTFAFEKLGHILYPGASFCGEVLVRDVGITDFGLTESSVRGTSPDPVYTLDQRDLAAFLPRRRPDANKGTYGKLLIIAGDVGMAGAAVLAGKSAARTGCGMVCVCTHPDNRIILQGRLPEALFASWPEEAKETEKAEETEKAAEAEASAGSGQNASFVSLDRWFQWADAVAIGPGLGTGPRSRALLAAVFCRWNGPLVIDADALNLMSSEPSLRPCTNDVPVITPHPGEMRRLLRALDMQSSASTSGTQTEQSSSFVGQIQEDQAASVGEPVPQSVEDISTYPIRTARFYAEKSGFITVLKGPRSVVTDGTQVMLNTLGNDGMASAGSGDCLTGIIGSLMAQGMAPFDAAQTGVLLHAAAGDCAAARLGTRSLTAGDLPDAVADVLSGLS